MFTQISHKITECHTFRDTDGRQWTVEFENNVFKGTSYALKNPYSRLDWARLAEFAGIIEQLCKERDTPFNESDVFKAQFDQEPEPIEEEAWKVLEKKHNIRLEDGV